MPFASLVLHLTSLYLVPANFTTIPSSNLSCRIYEILPFAQRECGACLAFAFATAASMHLCLRAGEDRIPSPFRLFDCTGRRCRDEEGPKTSTVLAALAHGVGDVRDSHHLYGLPCAPDANGSVAVTANWLNLRSHIKAALFLTGLPLIGEVDGLIAGGDGVYSGVPSDNKHALVLLGWGDGHWIVQNSWGEAWGDGGGELRILFSGVVE